MCSKNASGSVRFFGCDLLFVFLTELQNCALQIFLHFFVWSLFCSILVCTGLYFLSTLLEN